ncbi:hypothetical protein H2137_16285 [Aeromonas hydrophila]|uniref:hypothetical protein n=1 Tax=Aeromonas hydrophila TaxID=644 RepID=UPI001655A3A6|nr:hypothetical protein [Aeromonas hydrophila]MBC8673693.1 hypothetical protein [Aeromonas hydrophila]MBC8689555.1 hypothetical protein [Aeromonas hydrophila]
MSCKKHIYDVDRHHRIDGDSGHQVRLVASLLPCYTVGLAALVLYGGTSYPLLFVDISLSPITVFMLADRIINVVFNIGDMGLQKKGYTATVIPPFLGAFKSRGHAACARRCFGV